MPIHDADVAAPGVGVWLSWESGGRVLPSIQRPRVDHAFGIWVVDLITTSGRPPQSFVGAGGTGVAPIRLCSPVPLVVPEVCLPLGPAVLDLPSL
ncbi:MAG TPA: hypothetical protein VHM94_16350, partial [Acidimicrobiia bacterium]|nr:hypothetical protein [Acidimicrobiia bacterium]